MLLAGLLPGASAGQALESGSGPALRSFLVPGWGQLAMGQERGWAYVAVEAVAWTLHLHQRSEGGRAREAYRHLAWSTARTRPDARRADPGFAYFERLSRWARSGAWDRAPGVPGLQPEDDIATYNGMIWDRARDLFMGGDPAAGPSHPGYAGALAYYEGRAYGPELVWDWTGKEDDLDRYRDLIDESDHRFRRATHALGAVLANHVLSGVDAWISARSGARVSNRLVTTPGGGGTSWTWAVSVAP